MSRDLLGAHRVRHRVLVPLDRVTELLQRSRGAPGAVDRDDVVELAVRHEDRQVVIRRCARSPASRPAAGKSIAPSRPAAARDDAARSAARSRRPARSRPARSFVPRSRAISSSTSFCEARMPASSSGPPPSWRMSYQARMRMPWLMVTGPHRRVREHEAHRLGEAQLGHDRLEVVAVGAQAVQPDHRSGGVGPGFNFDGFHQSPLNRRGLN